MIKYILIFLLVISTSLQAQFPVTIIVGWDPNPVIDNVTSYTLAMGTTVVKVPTSQCTTTVCEQSVVIPSMGTYTVSVTSTNMWGTSLPTSLTFNASSPGRSGNLRIRIQ